MVPIRHRRIGIVTSLYEGGDFNMRWLLCGRGDSRNRLCRNRTIPVEWVRDTVFARGVRGHDEAGQTVPSLRGGIR